MITSRNLNEFSGAGYSRGRNKIWQLLWHFYSNAVFQKYWFPSNLRSVSLRLFGASIGKRVLIRDSVQVHWPWKLRVGDNSWIGHGVTILNLEPVDISDNVCISQQAYICTGSHDSSSETFEFANQSIRIESSVWVCARAFVLPGSHIPQGLVVPANSTYPNRKNLN